MASHGITRRPVSAAQSAKAREQERLKVEQYNALVAEVQTLRASNTYTTATLTTSSTLLSQNPEFNTIWNYRRRILLHLLSPMSADEKLKLLMSELEFLIPLLQSYPKCYWIWNYRIFLLQTCSEQLDVATALRVWKGEMKLVDKMLGRDARNFHGWGYRRGVVKEIEQLQGRISGEKEGEGSASLVEEEFAYTTAMYQKNLSNFSAWHNRSKLIPRLLDERNANVEERRTFLDGELGIMQEALFTDPYDQSLQLYHHWLISATCSPTSSAGTPSGEIVRLTPEQQLDILTRTLVWMKELLDEEPECRLLLEELIFVGSLTRGVAEANSGVTAEVSVDEVKGDMQAWLDKLIVVDPMRMGRWRELAERL
ncbi:hypothetical protein Dda_4349 [Drechslerella dactyloides]|uniref:Geranylgeranyl transferase type-2 subunit alpha n=1 Tax=Drechslerella dactyloides TaxID=74499 RepID=A0AAD6IWV0_DREDA|nr:hypothetical protein Dda_4349 [Drechslerella dactyloides]